MQHAPSALKSLFKYLCKTVPKSTFHDSDELERIVQSKLVLKLLKRDIAGGHALFKGSDIRQFISCHVEAVRTAIDEEDLDREVEFMKSLNALVTTDAEQQQEAGVVSLLMRHLEKSDEAGNKKHTLSGQHKQLIRQFKDLTNLVQRQLNRFHEHKTLSMDTDDAGEFSEVSELEELLGADEEDDMNDEQLYESMKEASIDIAQQLEALVANYAFLMSAAK